MSKRRKLFVFGFVLFVLVLLGVLFFTGFFTSPDTSMYQPLDLSEDVSLVEREVFILDKSLSVENIVVPKNTFFILRVLNKDKQIHKLVLLEEREEEFEVVQRVFVESGSVQEFRFLNYRKEEELPSKDLSSDNFLLSCTTCNSDKSQLMITAKK